MTQSENLYRQDVFLDDLRYANDRQQQRIWAEHQHMQLSFLQRWGLTSSSTLLDIGCGPMRLGSALIPLLKDELVLRARHQLQYHRLRRRGSSPGWYTRACTVYVVCLRPI